MAFQGLNSIKLSTWNVILYECLYLHPTLHDSAMSFVTARVHELSPGSAMVRRRLSPGVITDYLMLFLPKLKRHRLFALNKKKNKHPKNQLNKKR